MKVTIVKNMVLVAAGTAAVSAPVVPAVVVVIAIDDPNDSV